MSLADGKQVSAWLSRISLPVQSGHLQTVDGLLREVFGCSAAISERNGLTLKDSGRSVTTFELRAADFSGVGLTELAEIRLHLWNTEEVVRRLERIPKSVTSYVQPVGEYVTSVVFPILGVRIYLHKATKPHLGHVALPVHASVLPMISDLMSVCFGWQQDESGSWTESVDGRLRLSWYAVRWPFPEQSGRSLGVILTVPNIVTASQEVSAFLTRLGDMSVIMTMKSGERSFLVKGLYGPLILRAPEGEDDLLKSGGHRPVLNAERAYENVGLLMDRGDSL